MEPKRLSPLVAAFVVLGLVATACGGSDPAEPAIAPESAPEQDALPGEGVQVTMARGDWVETYFQNYVVKQLLEELGYEVSAPMDVAPTEFYLALAQGEYDLWASAWPLNHAPLLAEDLPGGGTVADEAGFVGRMMTSGALQGVLVDAAGVERFGFATLEELLDDPEAVAHYDSDADGRIEINGCDEGWGCHNVIDATLAHNGWEDRATQISTTYATLFTESQERLAAGGPVLQYVWTPSAYVAKLAVGSDVLWLSVDPERAIEGQDGVSEVGDACTNNPCTTMFTPSDIVVAANFDFLAANPAAASLLESFELDLAAVTAQAVVIDEGADGDDQIAAAATAWIANNRARIDPWINAALAAAAG